MYASVAGTTERNAEGHGPGGKNARGKSKTCSRTLCARACVRADDIGKWKQIIKKRTKNKSAKQLCKRDGHVARGRGKGHVVNAAGFAHAAVARAGLLATRNRSNASGGSDVAVVRL